MHHLMTVCLVSIICFVESQHSYVLSLRMMWLEPLSASGATPCRVFVPVIKCLSVLCRLEVSMPFRAVGM